jgi:hypothetical protein
MHPLLFLLLAILTPFALCAVLFLPPYLGMLGASYIVYDTGVTPHPLASHLYDVFYIIDVYSKLFSYAKANLSSIDLLHYALPVAVLPLAGVLIALWGARKFIRKMTDIFHISVGSH